MQKFNNVEAHTVELSEVFKNFEKKNNTTEAKTSYKGSASGYP